jgi:glycosidase
MKQPHDHKLIIYQVLLRLAGNTGNSNKLHGSIEENGCGKFNDLSPAFLDAVKEFGATHIWLTGALEHATCTGYSDYGIAPDNPLVVKGRAGSPYAIKDYYDVCPDLAVDVSRRMQEFEALVKRCHNAGLGSIIDFVPNHVARHYESDAKPEGVNDFGTDDDPSKAFSPSNNFYYLPGQELCLPPEVQQLPYVQDTKPGPYKESPARATGNDQFHPCLSVHDWYETVKLNYGVDYVDHHKKHFDPIPDTWHKMLDILLFWARKGVNGFRCDMAEMVPVEFWNWVIPKAKEQFPELVFIAEIYNPAAYRDFIHTGQFDYLYDKMGLYDTLRAVVEQQQPAMAITGTWQTLEGIAPQMLRFMENHDEQRIASRHFAGTAAAGIPAMTVSALIHQGPLMVYFGQETGESADGPAGFSGDDGRTTIFDYFSVPSFQRWYHQGQCNGGMLSEEEKKLRQFYQELLQLSRHPVITKGHFYDIMWDNHHDTGFNPDHCYAFLRWDDKHTWLVVTNFHPGETMRVDIRIPGHFTEVSGRNPIAEGKLDMLLQGMHPQETTAEILNGRIRAHIGPFSAIVLSLY